WVEADLCSACASDDASQPKDVQQHGLPPTLAKELPLWRVGRRVRPEKDGSRYGTVTEVRGQYPAGTVMVAWDRPDKEAKQGLPHDIQEWRMDALVIVCDDRA